MELVAIVAIVLGIQIGWTSRRIRREFAGFGRLVTRVRWQPLRSLFEGGRTRRQMLYRVWYADRGGEPFSCVVVATMFEGLTIEDERPDARPGARDVTALAPRGERPRVPWLAMSSSIVACLAMGVPYWTAPYQRLNLPSSLVGPGLALVVGLAGLAQFRAPRRWRTSLPILALAPVAVVSVRIAADLARDPTSHNLFPFELAIAAFVGASAALVGTAIGALARRCVPKAGA